MKNRCLMAIRSAVGWLRERRERCTGCGGRGAEGEGIRARAEVEGERSKEREGGGRGRMERVGDEKE